MTQGLSTAWSTLVPQPAESAVSFGGRQQEGEALQKAHAQALAQGGGVVLLLGPRGVGKGGLTAGLKQSLLRNAQGPVFTGSAVGQHRPYAALADALREALAHLDTVGAGHALRHKHAGVLGVLDPAQLVRTDGGQPQSRLSLMEGARALLRDVLSHGGATLMLTDVDAADEDTTALCAFLAQHLRADGTAVRGVLVLSASDTGALGTLASQLADQDHAHVVRVGGLDRDGLLRFLRNSAAVDRLLSASGGRPADVTELLSALPLDLGGLLDARLARLGVRARAVAEALSICESAMAVDALAAMTQTPAVQLAPVLAALTEDGMVLRRVANGALLFSLQRSAHAERLRNGLTPERRAALNLALAQHLEAKGAAMMEDGDLHLAEHFLAGGDAVSGVSYALTAAERLTVTHAYGAAAELMDRALAVAPGAAERQAVLSRRCELQLLRGNAVSALADAGRLKAMLPAAERGPAYRRLGELLVEAGRPRPAVRQLETALVLLGPSDGAERAQALAALASAWCVSGELARAAECAHSALALPLTDSQRIKVRNTLGKVALLQEAFDVADRVFRQNVEEGTRLGLMPEVTRGEINVGVTAFRRGQYELAEKHLGLALQHAERMSDVPSQAFCMLNLGSLRHQRRDLSGALHHHHQALTLFSRMGNRAEALRARLNVANLCLHLGDLDQAALHLERGRLELDGHGLNAHRAYLHALEADLHGARGQLEEARASYQAARERYLEAGQRGRAAEQWLRVAQVALRQRDQAGAQDALGHLTAQKTDLDHAHLRAEAAVAQARLALLGAQGSEAAGHVQALLDQARTLLGGSPDAEILAMITLCEAEGWAHRGDTRRAERLDAQARDILHKVAAELPPNLRDGYVRSRALALGSAVAAPRAAQFRNDVAAAMAPTAALEAPASTDPDHGPRGEAWNTRYAAMVGNSPQLLRVFGRLDRLQGSLSTVLIRGESGTGKELVANALHMQSPRASGPFVKVNCAALVETLLLSELFGHEKGSFTGAHTRKVGRFELARGGTIFLDEIGDISANTQVALLRVLQERVFERVGGNAPLKTDCRIICATNRNLEAMVKAGTFREDLYYRLKGVQVELPALRQRREDIPALVEHVVAKAAVEMGRRAPSVTPTAMELLGRYDWPGNVRELENAIRSVVLFVDGDTMDVEHLAEFRELKAAARSTTPVAVPGSGATPLPLGQMKKQLEFDSISRALEEARGNISRAADLLQMKRPRLSQIVNGNEQLKAIKERFRAEGGEA